MKKERLETLVNLFKGHDVLTKTNLAIALGTDERQIRRLISDARKQGVPICSSSHGKGYWLGDKDDIKTLVAEYRHRAKEMIETADILEDSTSFFKRLLRRV